MDKPTAGVGIIEQPAGVHNWGCMECEEHFLHADVQREGTATYTESFSDEEAQEWIQDLIDIVEEAQERLQEILEEYGDLILSRWNKKSKPKREQILQKTTLIGSWGTEPMPACKNLPWIQANGKSFSCGPWLSTKPLAEDRTRLLSLLHLRSSYHSSDLALLDCKELSPVFGAGWDRSIPYYFNDKCVRMCRPDYGELAEWGEQLAHSWAIVGFPRASLMLLTQRWIMKFCLEVTAELCKDAEPRGNGRWMQQVAAGFKAPGSDLIWSNYTNPAFAPPVLFDPDYLLQKATSRKRLALDEIWLLQTDPVYMLHVIRSRKSNFIYDKAGAPGRTQRWAEVARTFIDELYHRLGFWHIITLRCEELSRAIETTGFERGEQVAKDTRTAMWNLSNEIHGRIRLSSEVLESLLPTMSAVKSRYTTFQSGFRIYYQESATMSPDNNRDRLAVGIERLQNAIQRIPGVHDVVFSFDLLERELRLKESADLVDQRLLDCLSDMAAMDEMFGIIKYNQIGWTEQLVPDPENLTWAEGHERHVDRYREACKMMEWSTVERLGKLLESFYEAPWPKGKQDLAWFEKATKSRQRLASFWKLFRDELLALQNESAIKAGRDALHLINFDTEPEFLAELESERLRCEAQSAQDSAAAAERAERLLRELSISDAISESRNDILPVRRKKTKAKAIRQALELKARLPPPNLEKDEPISSSSIEDDIIDSEPIAVKQESFGVFGKMYPSAGNEAGSVRWQLFVQAMVDAGFTATSCSGSAVSFSSDQGAISIHKPHPEPVIEAVVLQGIGRRMGKWFGWNTERFVLREKEHHGV